MKIIIVSLFFFVLTTFSQAEPKIWSCAVYAKAGEGEVDSALNQYTNDMQRIFGYHNFEIMDSQWSSQPMDQPNCMTLTKEFALKLVPLTVLPDKSKFYLKLYQKKDILLKSRVHLPDKSPLYIAGPAYGKGKIIFILEVKSQPEK